MIETWKNTEKNNKITKIFKLKVNKTTCNKYKFPINKVNSQTQSFNNKYKVLKEIKNHHKKIIMNKKKKIKYSKMMIFKGIKLST
jgi:hypothetical protein